MTLTRFIGLVVLVFAVMSGLFVVFCLVSVEAPGIEPVAFVPEPPSRFGGALDAMMTAENNPRHKRFIT